MTRHRPRRLLASFWSPPNLPSLFPLPSSSLTHLPMFEKLHPSTIHEFRDAYYGSHTWISSCFYDTVRTVATCSRLRFPRHIILTVIFTSISCTITKNLSSWLSVSCQCSAGLQASKNIQIPLPWFPFPNLRSTSDTPFSRCDMFSPPSKDEEVRLYLLYFVVLRVDSLIPLHTTPCTHHDSHQRLVLLVL